MRFLFVFLFIKIIFAYDLPFLDDKTSSEVEISLPLLEEEDINIDNKTQTKTIKVAILINKEEFFKYLPTLMNSIDAYFLNKNVDFKIKVFNLDENTDLDEITKNYKNIFVYTLDKNLIEKFNNYPDNKFFLPIINKNFLNTYVSKNIFFGGLDFKDQVDKLNSLIFDKINVITENKKLSNLVTKVEIENLIVDQVYTYPLNYKEVVNDLNQTSIFINTATVHTAQILSNFTYYRIEPQIVLSTQINFNPIIFYITTPEDVKNFIVASSLFINNMRLLDVNLNLNSDLKFNWLNYTTTALLNKLYVDEMGENPYFLNDMNLYIFNNQVNYKTKLYKIFMNGFIEIE